MDNKLVCIVCVILIAILFFRISKEYIEPFIDLNINLEVSDQLYNRCNNILKPMDYLNKKTYSRCLNPTAPEEISSREGCMPVDIPTRETNGGYYQVGHLKRIRDNSGKINKANFDELPIYQRRNPNNFRQWFYYTTTDSRNPFKIPLKFSGINCQGKDGCSELHHDDIIDIPEVNASYRVVKCQDSIIKNNDNEANIKNSVRYHNKDACYPIYFPDRHLTRNPSVYIGTEW